MSESIEASNPIILPMPKGRRKDRAATPLECEIHKLLVVVGLKLANLSGAVSPPDDGGIAHGSVFDLFAGTLSLSRKTVVQLRQRLQTMVDRRLMALRKEGLPVDEFLRALKEIKFIDIEPRPVVRPDKMVGLYRGPHSPRDPPDFATFDPRAAGAGSAVVLIFHKPFEELSRMSPEALGAYARTILEITGPASMAQVTEGCTEISLVLTTEQTRMLFAAYDRGDLSSLGLVGIESRPTSTNSGAELTQIDPTAKDAVVQCSRFMMGAIRREKWVRPWRRLRMLCSARIAMWPQAPVLLASDSRAYAFPLPSSDMSARWADLRMAWLGGPLLAALIITAVLGFVKVFVPELRVGLGLASGLVLGFAGAQVCSAVVSPLATAAGAVTIGLGFGLGHGLILGDITLASHLSREMVLKDPFLTINGGILGLSAPSWRGYWPAWGVVPLLLMIAAGIAASGWFMAQPQRVMLRPPQSTRREIWIGVGASCVGAGIGLVFGLTKLLTVFGLAPTWSAAVAFGIVGGTLLAWLTWWKSHSAVRAILFGSCHGLIAFGLASLSFRWAGSERGFFALAATTAWFHATWFTGAFAVAIRYGTPRSAFVATTLEGAAGFTAFVASQWLTR